MLSRNEALEGMRRWKWIVWCLCAVHSLSHGRLKSCVACWGSVIHQPPEHLSGLFEAQTGAVPAAGMPLGVSPECIGCMNFWCVTIFFHQLPLGLCG